MSSSGSPATPLTTPGGRTGRRAAHRRDPVDELGAAPLTGEPQLLDRLGDAGVVRVAVIVEHDRRAWTEDRPPGVDLGDRLLALVGAVDIEQIDRRCIRRPLRTRTGDQLHAFARSRTGEREVAPRLGSLDDVERDHAPATGGERQRNGRPAGRGAELGHVLRSTREPQQPSQLLRSGSRHQAEVVLGLPGEPARAELEAHDGRREPDQADRPLHLAEPVSRAHGRRCPADPLDDRGLGGVHIRGCSQASSSCGHQADDTREAISDGCARARREVVPGRGAKG